jgi:hypothetical protein
MSTLPVAGERKRHRRGGRGLLLLPLAVFAAVACAACAYIGYVLWPRWPGPPVVPDAPALPVTVAGVAFNLPPAAIRVPVQRRPGAQERVDLAFLWPSLAPPEANGKPQQQAREGLPAPPSVERIFVTISAAGDTLAPAERMRNVYARYTAAAPTPGPRGLSVLPFREGTPYQGEDLIYDAATPTFLARCSRNGVGPTPGICLYERRIEGADLTLRFPRDWLEDWPLVASNIDRLIARLRPSR